MTNPAFKSASPLDLYTSGRPQSADSWLVSDWNAGQSSLTKWSSNNVRVGADGQVEMVLSSHGHGSGRSVVGAEIQNTTSATTGTWSWTAQAPEMVPGAVFGMFTYKSDWKNQPWVEFDFEFVGADTTKVQLNIHMEDAQGRHVILDTAAQGRAIIDLGFDAAKGLHTYEVTVTEKNATFYIDGKVVGEFNASDMQGDVWQIGPMNSFVDLWAVDRGQEAWAGKWQGLDAPLVASISDADIRPGEFGSHHGGDNGPDAGVPDGPATDDPDQDDDAPDADPDTMSGTSGNDALNGNSANNTLFGLAGDDVLDGKGGADAMHGNAGDDAFWVDHASDRTIEKAGEGYDTTHAAISWTLAENVEALSLRTAANINGTGNAADNFINGNSGSNTIAGLAGKDVLEGRGGHDVLIGGTGDDKLVGGAGKDTFRFAAGDGQDTVTDFSAREGEVLDVHGYEGFVELRAENGGTRVVLSGGDSILLDGVKTADLSAQNFLFNGVVPDAFGGDASAPPSGVTPTPVPEADPAPAGINLLVNGSFESSPVAAGKYAAFGSVLGWTALSGGGIELWNGMKGVSATQGDTYAELDHLGARDGFYQDVDTVARQTYTLSFDLRGRPETPLSTQQVEVVWNDKVVATATPGTSWDTFRVDVTGTGGDDRLTLREVGSQGGDGLGALLDDVSLVAKESSAGSKNLVGSAFGDTLQGDGRGNDLSGLGGDDLLDGRGGDDVLTGGAGRDTLTGGAGTDVLFGGEDRSEDMFVFHTASDSRPGTARDTVHDFVPGIDAFDFRAFDANASAAGHQDIRFSGSNAAAHSVWTVASGSDLVLRADVTGDRIADFEALVTDIHALTQNDFLL